MRIIEPSVILDWDMTPKQIMLKIERAGRTAYKSEGKIGPGTAEKFVNMILKRGHESVIEHAQISARIITNRGVSHELVRHRIASFVQESTRYCNYAHDNFGHEITIVRPHWAMEPSIYDTIRYQVWVRAMQEAERNYFAMLAHGFPSEDARDVLPIGLKTEIYTTFNLREWKHFFRLRGPQTKAHPNMRIISGLIYREMSENLPLIFPPLPPSEPAAQDTLIAS